MADNKINSPIIPETEVQVPLAPEVDETQAQQVKQEAEQIDQDAASSQINSTIQDQSLDDRAEVEPSLELYDFAENRVRKVPESLVQKAILSKQFGFKKGIKVPVQSPDGQFGQIDPEEAFKAFNNKYSFDTSVNRGNRENEAKLEEQFGDKGLTSFTTGALSGLTLGLSDQALVKSGLFNKEELREIRERSPVASTVGEIAGFVGPLVATGGGTGVAALGAKGLAKAGVAVKGAAAAGKLTEKAVGNIVKKVLKDTGKKSLAKKIIQNSAPRALGSAVEGSFFGLGQVLSEDALGRAELNAENVLSGVGMGAVLGGATGGIFGAAEATVPSIAKGVKGAAESIKGKVADKFKNAVSREDAFFDLVGMTANARTKLKNVKAKMVEELPEWFAKKADVKTFSSSKSHFENLNKVRQAAGEEIGSVMNKIDENFSKVPDIIPDRSVITNKINDMLDQNYISKFLDDPASRSALAPIRRLMKVTREVGERSKQMTAKELHQWRRSVDREINYSKRFSESSLHQKALRDVRDVLSDQIFELAEQASLIEGNVAGELATRLRAANKDFSYSSSIIDHLEKKIDKDLNKNFLSFQDYIFGGAGISLGDPTLIGVAAAKKFIESDLKNRIILLSNVEKQVNKVSNTINRGVDGFLGLSDKGFGRLRKVAGPLSTKALLKNSFSDNDKKRKKPKNKAEAFNLISEEITERIKNPEKTMLRMQTKTARLRKAAPNIAQQIEMAAIRAVNFLFEKMPKADQPAGSFQLDKRQYEPSTMEMSKFERYLTAVNDPMSVVQDLAEGNLSPEGVETLRTVYPEIYTELQTSIMDKIGTLDKELSYDKRLQLGMLFELPTDPSLMPRNIAGLQQQFLSEEEKENIQVQDRASDTGVVNTSVTGLKQLDKAARSVTPLGRVQGK